MSEKKGFFSRLVSGLAKTRKNIVRGLDSIFNGFSKIDDDFYEELEEILIMGDLGVDTTMKIIDDLQVSGSTVSFTVSHFSVFDFDAIWDLVDWAFEQLWALTSRVITTAVGDFELQLSGRMPKGAEATAAERAPVVPGETVLAAADIALSNRGNAVEPSSWNDALSVTMTGEDIRAAIQAGATLNVYHVDDDNSLTAVTGDITVGEDSVSFLADTFSGYAVTADHTQAEREIALSGDVTLAGTMPLNVQAKAEDAAEAVLALADRNAAFENVLSAADITLTNYGFPVQPAGWNGTVTVTMGGDAIAAYLAEGKKPAVYHIADTGAQTLLDDSLVTVTGNAVSFTATEFSVYAVVGEGEVEPESRATVNFYGKDHTTPIATVYVKADDTRDELEYILYDPGAGELDETDLFRGWVISTVNTTDGADYDVDSTTASIEGVRDFLASQTIAEGDVYNIYAAIFTAYSVQFKDEDGVTIHSDTLIRRYDEPISYTITTGYTPKSQDSQFTGWNVTTGSDKISPAPSEMEGGVYPVGQTISVDGNLIFSPIAPKGYWLVFRENGKGVSYTPPQFIQTGERPETVPDPSRFGYTFDGWWTGAPATEGDDPTGTRVTDLTALELTQRTTLYAKWVPNESANYTVIVWKQNVAGNGYDFVESIPLSGTVGTNVSTVSQQGTGNNAYARINGTDYQYTGFHLKAYDQNVAIVPEGNSVVNVYYDRNEYTLSFQAQEYTYTQSTSNNSGYYYIPNGNGGYEQVYLYRYNGRWYVYYSSQYNDGATYTGNKYTRSNQASWQTIKTITALYGQNIRSSFPITGTNGIRYEGALWQSNGSRVFDNSAYVGYIDTMQAESTTFRLAYNPASNYTTYYIRYYVEALPGETGTVTFGGKRFKEYYSTSVHYQGTLYSSKSEEFTDITGFTQFGSNPEYDSTGRASFDSNNTISLYYTRNVYPINYMDGVYVDGDNNPIDEDNHGQWREVADILYGADISSYNENGSNYYVPTKEGYAFEGWYIDDACTQKYTFTTMPEGGVTVYAKWIKKQYRVFLHPNVESADTSLDAVRLAEQILALQEKFNKNDSESMYAASNADILAQAYKSQGKNKLSAEMYLKAAKYYRICGKSDDAATTMYGAYEAFMAAGMKADANATAKKLKELYPSTRQARAARTDN